MLKYRGIQQQGKDQQISIITFKLISNGISGSSCRIRLTFRECSINKCGDLVSNFTYQMNSIRSTSEKKDFSMIRNLRSLTSSICWSSCWSKSTEKRMVRIDDHQSLVYINRIKALDLIISESYSRWIIYDYGIQSSIIYSIQNGSWCRSQY